ncbi:MAG TPA: hypothetical protein VJL80_14465 [Aeromicrobium sp.]|nr:hypothetical protein [Aeromicrobium sp.]HKY59237.1 hypothetical protein [Aeromicrobium sp.]
MNEQYAPGTPVKVTIRDEEVLAYAFYGTAEPRLRWYVPNPPWPIKTHDPEQDFDTWFLGSQGTNPRPLLMVDPEDLEQTSALFHAADTTLGGFRERLPAMAAPVPPEPTGERAVVVDKEGDAWQKRTTSLMWANTYGGDLAWRALSERYGPLTVVSEGYTPEAK